MSGESSRFTHLLQPIRYEFPLYTRAHAMLTVQYYHLVPAGCLYAPWGMQMRAAAVLFEMLIWLTDDSLH